MENNRRFLITFFKRYEFLRMNLGISNFNTYKELQSEISTLVWYPGYTHTDYFDNYCKSISYYLVQELKTTIDILKPGKFKEFTVFFDYNNTMFDNFAKLTTQYFDEIFKDKDVNIAIAMDLKLRVDKMIHFAQSSTKRNIELILEAHNFDCKIKMKERVFSFLSKIGEQLPSLWKLN